MNHFLTGVPGAGKTTLLDKRIAELKTSLPQLLITGFFTTRERTAETTTFWLNDRVTRESCLMAKTFSDRFEVNLDAFERFAAEAIERGLTAASSGQSVIIVLDELGRFEEPCERFKATVYAALDSEIEVYGVLKLVNTPFVSSIRDRSDVELQTLLRVLPRHSGGC
jgi:nucleoside-triphosphatase THEP1